MKSKLLENGVKIALAQMDVRPGNPRAQGLRAIKEMKEAEARGVEVLVLPELWMSGYMIGDEHKSNDYVRDVRHWTGKVIEANKGMKVVIIFGSYGTDNPDQTGRDGTLLKYNAAYVVQGGKVLAMVPKTLLPDYRFFDDDRYFDSTIWRALRKNQSIDSLIQPVPVLIRGMILKIGVMICEDMWKDDYALSPGHILVKNGAEILINISCSPWGWQKNRKRHQVVRALVKELKVPFIYVNNVGTQNNVKNILVFDGGTTVYNERGDVAVTAHAHADEVIDVEVTYGMSTTDSVEPSDDEQSYFATRYGLRGYFRTLPPAMRRTVIGVSGGIDSAVVAAASVDELGAENVTLVNMPYGSNNSPRSREAARKLAENLGVKDYRVVDITASVDILATTLGVQKDTPAHKHLQAVTRMKVLSTITFEVGGVITCNGNKTEGAFGYFTTNGDGRGGIAILGDIIKGNVYRLALYYNSHVYGRKVIPDESIKDAPTDGLTSRSDPDPYLYGKVTAEGVVVKGYHDELVRAFTEFKMYPESVLELYAAGTLEEHMLLPSGQLKERFPSAQAFVDDLEKQWIAHRTSPWKRAQNPPNIVSSRSAYGYDRREFQPYHDDAAYFTDKYLDLKRALLGKAIE